MGFDPFDPLAAARINVEVVPAGRLESSSFKQILHKLQTFQYFTVGQSDSQPEDGAAQRLLFNFASDRSSSSQIEAFPYEANRAPQILLAVADCREYTGFDAPDSQDLPNLEHQFEVKRKEFTSTLVQVLVVCHCKNVSLNQGDVLLIKDDLQPALDVIAKRFLFQADKICGMIQDAPIRSPRLASSRDAPFVPRNTNSSELGSSANQDSGIKTHQDRKTDASRPSEGRPEPNGATSEGQVLAPNTDTPRSKGRQNVVVGTFDLFCGKPTSAFTALEEGARLAQSIEDTQWLRKALENMLVAMVLLDAQGHTFETPEIYHLLSRTIARQGDFSSLNNAYRKDSLSSQPKPKDSHSKLAVLLSSPVEGTIRFTGFSASHKDSAGVLLLCEQQIRLLEMFIILSNGLKKEHDTSSSALISRDLNVVHDPANQNMFNNVRVSRLAELVSSTFTRVEAQLSATDRASTLIGLTAALSKVNRGRKLAFYLQSLLQKLASSLLERRRIAAAESGVHPAAGLVAAVDSKSESQAAEINLEIFLNMVLHSCGLSPLSGMNSSPQEPVTKTDPLDDTEYAPSGRHSSLQIEMLRSCINFCDSLPAPLQSLKLSSRLLFISRQSSRYGSDAVEEAISISGAEQRRWFGHINKVVAVGKKLGMGDIQAEYWDPSLVQAVATLDDPSTPRLEAHHSKELALRTGPGLELRKDPFIFKSFAGLNQQAGARGTGVTKELLHFRVRLQNLFEFDIQLEKIALLTEGCDFESDEISCTIGPSRTKEILITGTPFSEGSLKILGCRAKVRDCFERSFYTNTLPHAILPFSTKYETWRAPSILSTRDDVETINGAKSDSLVVTIHKEQPVLSIASTSLTSPSMMLLEGETQSFTLSLKNESSALSIDLMLFSYEDSVTRQLQSALENRDLPPGDIYELSHQLRKSFISRRRDADNNEIHIPPLATHTATFDVFGKPGLFEAVVQIDYAHLGRPRLEVKGKFFTRQLRYPVSVTVNGSVEIPRFNILPHAEMSAQKDTGEAAEDLSDESVVVTQQNGSPSSTQQDHCLIALDLRNVWPQPLLVELHVDLDEDHAAADQQPTSSFGSVSEQLQPGQTSRVILSRPLIFLQDPRAPIPFPDDQRQYVVSATKTSLEAEYAAREAFWYRERLVKSLHGTWKEPISGRSGEIDLRKAVRLSPRMIETVRMDIVEIDFDIKLDATHMGGNSSKQILRLARSHFSVPVEDFATLKVCIHNRSADRLQLLLRLQPALRDQPHNVALDLAKKFAWTGVLQKALQPPLEAGATVEASLGIIALTPGKFEVHAVVEELRPARPSQSQKASGIISQARRTWHARQPCLIDADEDEVV